MRGEAARTLSAKDLVSDYFDRVELTYNSVGSVTDATFLYDSSAGKFNIKATGTVGTSLRNKYFIIDTPKDGTDYYIYFTVDGIGNDPALDYKTGIEVPLMSDYPAQIVGFGIYLVLKSLPEFTVQTSQDQSIVTIEMADGGQSDVYDYNTNFDFTTLVAGVTEEVATITLPYDNETKYEYNAYTRTFEIVPVQKVEFDQSKLTTLIEIQTFALLSLATTDLLVGNTPSDLLTDDNGHLLTGN